MKANDVANIRHDRPKRAKVRLSAVFPPDTETFVPDTDAEDGLRLKTPVS